MLPSTPTSGSQIVGASEIPNTYSSRGGFLSRIREEAGDFEAKLGADEAANLINKRLEAF